MSTLFIKIGDGGKMLIVCLYVDDLIFTRNDDAMFDKFKKSMMVEFDMSDLGMMHYFLGIEVMQFATGIFVSQKFLCARNFKHVSYEELQFC